MQIWKVSAQGGEERQLTSGDERMRHVFYSPDGRWIYVQPSHRNIYRLPAEGGPLRPVTNFPESGLFIEEPTISPDGRFLVYSRSRGGSSLWLLTLGTMRVVLGPSAMTLTAGTRLGPYEIPAPIGAGGWVKSTGAVCTDILHFFARVLAVHGQGYSRATLAWVDVV